MSMRRCGLCHIIDTHDKRSCPLRRLAKRADNVVVYEAPIDHLPTPEFSPMQPHHVSTFYLLSEQERELAAQQRALGGDLVSQVALAMSRVGA